MPERSTQITYRGTRRTKTLVRFNVLTTVRHQSGSVSFNLSVNQLNPDDLLNTADGDTFLLYK
jgi:hypothetical protein